MTESVLLTTAAATKVWNLIQEEKNPNLKLRVYITGGGCSGFQYGFSFDEEVNSDDTIVETDAGPIDSASLHTVQLLIDSLSFQYLAGAQIDYQDDLEGAQFIIRNPNAKTTCGCGSSFSA